MAHRAVPVCAENSPDAGAARGLPGFGGDDVDDALSLLSDCDPEAPARRPVALLVVPLAASIVLLEFQMTRQSKISWASGLSSYCSRGASSALPGASSAPGGKRGPATCLRLGSPMVTSGIFRSFNSGLTQLFRRLRRLCYYLSETASRAAASHRGNRRLP